MLLFRQNFIVLNVVGKCKLSEVDEYLINLTAPERTELERVRNTIEAAFPQAEVVMSYGIPGFKYKGKYLAGYAAFRDHISFFSTAKPIEVMKDRLSAYQLSKGTIQYPLEQPLPESLIKELVEVRLAAIEKG